MVLFVVMQADGILEIRATKYNDSDRGDDGDGA